MPIGLVGRKCGMTRVFMSDGESVPVTLVQVEKNSVVQVKTPQTDGYSALQISFGKKRQSAFNKPMVGHYARAGLEVGLGLWEFRTSLEETKDIKLGQALSLDTFSDVQFVDVRAVTKGKGFAGTIKRHHFHSQNASHGASLAHRTPGSTGMCQDPGRVFPGKKMPGQLGNVRRTIRNQRLVRIDTEKGFLLIKGGVPGARGTYVIIVPSSINSRG